MKTQINWSTREYERAHGKKPRGTGQWAFRIVHTTGNGSAYNTPSDPVWIDGQHSLTKAKALLAAQLESIGVTYAVIQIAS